MTEMSSLGDQPSKLILISIKAPHKIAKKLPLEDAEAEGI